MLIDFMWPLFVPTCVRLRDHSYGRLLYLCIAFAEKKKVTAIDTIQNEIYNLLY